MATDTVLNELILQEVTQAEYEQLEKDNLLDENRVYLTPDGSLKGILLDFKWADHLLNDISWLRADTFSWHDGEMYKAAYNHLVADFEGATAEIETIDGIEITYYRAEDKHKICLPDQEDKLLELYNATGVAWYYIIDTANKQFKLPRSKHNKYVDTVPVAGNGKTLGLTDGTSTFSIAGSNNLLSSGGSFFARASTETLYNVGENVTGWGNTSNGVTVGVSTDADKSGIIGQQTEDTDQYKYLYFYVGNFERDAVEQTAGITTETLNQKADKDLGNIPANYDYVVESQEPTAENGYTWYRKYKSGWVEQGGRLTQSGSAMLPIEMSNNNYNLQVRLDYNSNGTIQGSFWYATKTTTGFTMGQFSAQLPIDWQVSGMSQG